MRARELLKESADSYANMHNALRDFLPLAMNELGLQSVPAIKIERTLNYNGQPRCGSFSDRGIELGINGRHPVDVCRTLAHELVHFKQGQANLLNDQSGETGSNEENQANSVAGIIMRKFSKEFPEYINGQ